ncbi:hypothetical protein CKK33_15450 [Mucilaginibacter sp. MD40]|uniref:hybrid sensor histidine kinase/response regulator transcription factor n=1 Tax=Mucilaginibacter sp. MD40 TaxID=2029590 RepID=UPI000BACD760|nr:response regulator [Mucilaginibacter sp. MD40]PAW94811.1 hypothetical protein CKK33_15450 [Mucilaginibacter sp. MD40]
MTVKNYRIKTYRYLLAFAIVYIGILPLRVFAQPENYPYRIKYLTVDEGLSHVDANDITQDNKGFIWVATYFGLDRFDGNSIKRFYNSNDPLKNAYRNRITSVYADNNDDIWLGTEGGLQRFEVRTERYIDYHCDNQLLNDFKKIYKPSANRIYVQGTNQIRLFEIKGTKLTELKLPLHNSINVADFAVAANGNLLLATNKGVWEIDHKERIRQVQINGLDDKAVNHLSINEYNELMLVIDDKFVLASPGNSHQNVNSVYTIGKTYTSPYRHKIKSVISDGKCDYWINESSRLIHLDKNLQLKQEISNKSPQQTLNSHSLIKIFIDRSQCMWICMFGGGVNYFDLNEKPFYTLQHLPGEKNSLSGSYIRSVLAMGDELWIGTYENGLNLYNLKTRRFSYYNSYNTPVKLKNDVVNALTPDRSGNLWIGTDAGIDILDAARQAVIRPTGSQNFPSYSIESLATDYFGNIWFGNHTNKCGVIYRDDDGTFKVKYYGQGLFILAETNRPYIMISSTHGLRRLIVDKYGNTTAKHTFTATNSPNSLSSDYTYPIVKQTDSVYWIGTIGGGLNRLIIKGNTYSITQFSRYNMFKDVESMELDNKGNIWMGGNGLERFNPVSKTLIRYDKNDGLQGNSFKVGASYKGSDGRLYFGGLNGLNYFYPDQIHENTIPAIPRITDIIINNQHPAIGHDKSGDNNISQSITYSNKLKINYLQNNFVIYFSAMHFANPSKCKYRYKLLGFDNDWRYTDGKNPSASYNNIDYADYTFIVEASNHDGIWSHQTAALNITVTPPWWKSWPAKLFYALLLLSGLAGIYLYQARWYKLKRDIEVGRVNEKKREEIHRQREELHQQQLVFFTNISHEFRTPLTLIVGPLEHLIHENKDVHLNSSYQLILRNARRLMNLITELMNFKKVADSVIKLQVQQLDIYRFCTGLFTDFENIALSKDIKYRLINHAGDNYKGWFDVQVLEKIVFNLLNNAFKYTDNNGEVKLELFTDLENFKPSFRSGFKLLHDRRAENYFYIRVADTGIGISPESIGNIFERYYRISSNHIGSGVGLALVKSLTQLHKGDIYVYSERMAGTEIIIGIPVSEHDYTIGEKIAYNTEVRNRLEPIDKAIVTTAEHHIQQPELIPEADKRILIVEDNIELRRFLKQVFDKYYQVIEAEDGEKGLKLAIENTPDIIISDVMMPKMNGIELCKLIKEKFETRHIPFIILSANNAMDSRIEGVEYGADYYFAKPLSVDLLLLTIRNIFAQREIVKQRFLNNYLSSATDLVKSEVDKEFFEKLIEVIEKDIQRLDLDVDYLCRNLFVSRTKLYQKIKSISGQSVGEFIRTIRLKKSIEIMTHENVSMNEVADRIGMQSSSNFSRAFKKEYGKSPLQFMQALRKNESASH